MRTLDVAVLIAPLFALASGGPSHVVVDSALGVAIGVVAVLLYVVALRWFGGSDDGNGREGRSRRRDERRSNR